MDIPGTSPLKKRDMNLLRSYTFTYENCIVSRAEYTASQEYRDFILHIVVMTLVCITDISLVFETAW